MVEEEDMRVIPVIDLLQGQVVHAVKGLRQNYKPIKSVLCNAPDPLKVAKAFRTLLNLNEVYIADLDAIQNSHQARNRRIIAEIASREGMDVLVDAGVSNIADINELIACGARKAVIGSETLQTLDAVQHIPSRINRDRLIFSLDLRDGKILSRCPDLSAMKPLEAMRCLASAGWREVILLDLKRVGSGEGIAIPLVREARAKLPELRLLAGGGIANPGELTALKSLGISGVLTASALHQGTITARDISALS
jgi:phosphoribosylformimino-5-aminoimidazole carboxamide ribotide isomerase